MSRSFLDGDGAGHLDLPRARAGGLAGGLFAVFVPTPEPDGDRDDIMRAAEYDVPLPAETELTYAQAYALRDDLAALPHRPALGGRACASAAPPRISATAIEAGALATVLHLEGAEPIDRDFKMLEVLLRGRPALDRAGLEPAQHLRAWRAVPLPEHAGYRRRADGGGQGAGEGLQRAEDRSSTCRT